MVPEPDQDWVTGQEPAGEQAEAKVQGTVPEQEPVLVPEQERVDDNRS